MKIVSLCHNFSDIFQALSWLLVLGTLRGWQKTWVEKSPLKFSRTRCGFTVATLWWHPVFGRLPCEEVTDDDLRDLVPLFSHGKVPDKKTTGMKGLGEKHAFGRSLT